MICGAAITAVSAAEAHAQAAAPSQVAEVVVTGSHIPRPNLEQAAPIAVMTGDMIQSAGPQNLGDVIARLPQLGTFGTLRANSNNSGASGVPGAGVSALDLRSLGLSRTLVLVDGQRHVAGDIGTNAVDVNSIPSALVERVEVTTGGASAVYGSDAVSGVVNIITKKRFEGLELETQAGGYDNGFGAKYDASVTAGRDFLDKRLNLAVSGFWRKEDGIVAGDVPSARNYGLILNPADTRPLDAGWRFGGVPTPNDGIPDKIFVPNVGSELTTRNGTLINALTGGIVSFDAAGHVVPTPVRTGYNSFGFGQLPADCASCYFGDATKQISSPIESKGAALLANMDFGPHLHGFVDAKFVQNDVENSIQPSFIAGQYGLRDDNAFLTPEIRAALGPFPAGAFVFSQFLNDARTQDIRRRTYRVVAGLDGDFDGGLAQVKWNGALNYGETDIRILSHGVRIEPNFAAALDSVIDPATGKPACRINVPSAPQTGQGAGALNPSACVPWDPFGQQNGAAALAYSFGTFWTTDKLTQQVANLNATFDTGRVFSFQGGPVGVATGAEYRMERLDNRNDPMLLAGLTENVAANSSGGFNVAEGYVEVNAPVFRRAGPGLDELSFDLAYRGAHYSTVGGVGAYKVSAVYGPADWIKLRGTYSRAIRAPNITEAYMPSSPNFFAGLKDPCSAENIGANVNYARNCAAAGLPPGFVATSGVSVPGQESGNPDLNPERSFSYTAGVVLQPTMVRNLSVTLDYYSIKIKDAITEVAAQDIINNCYGSSSGLDANYCALFTRDPNARNNISFVQTTFVNASKLYTDGFELQVNYAAEVAPLTGRWRATRGLDGRLGFTLTADYVRHLRNYPFQSNPAQANILEGTATTAFGNNPQLKGLAELDYVQGPLSLAWTTRYVGKQALFSRDPGVVDQSESLDIPFTEPTFYHDLRVSWRLGGMAQGTELFAGADNIFDEEPPFTVLGTGRDMSFDLGRFLFVGARYRR
jgi:outer membrane receptor protein involved in Fe transport